MLYDLFGDGSKGTRLHIFDTHGFSHSIISQCNDDITLEEYCFDERISKIGDYVTATVIGLNYDHPWEVSSIHDIQIIYLFLFISYMIIIIFFRFVGLRVWLIHMRNI